MVTVEKPVGLVTPWFGRDLQGGAERHAWELAARLAARGHPVEVITTCCRAFEEDWATNHLPAGLLPEPEGFSVRRFPVCPRDRKAFDRVNLKLMALHRADLQRGVSPLDPDDERVFADELMHSPELLDHLRSREADYAAFIFIPYLYFTTLRGLPLVENKAALIPCLHHEAYAFLPLVGEVFRRARRILYLGEGEARLAEWMFGPGISPRGLVAGGGVEMAAPPDDGPSFSVDSLKPFVLCLGRQDPGKNTDFLARAYAAYQAQSPQTPLKLVLAGPGNTILPEAASGIVNLGKISETDKHWLLAGCQALLNPSVNESYSRVIMEAWYLGRPVVVHRSCLATATAVAAAQGGWLAGDEDDWIEAFERIERSTPDALCQLGASGLAYAREMGAWDQAIVRYEAAIRATATPLEIHQVLSNLCYGDAISNETHWIKHALRRAGFKSEIYALDIDPRLADEAFQWKPGCLDPAAAVIYHYAMGSAFTQEVCAHPGPKALLYHNITPHHFFDRSLPLHSQLCRTGREELPQLARSFPVSAGDSTYNVIELTECGFDDPVVLPLCIDPRKLDLPPDPGLMGSLQDGRTNILFVGRLAPNKRHEDLIFAFAEYLKLDPSARLHLVGSAVIPDDPHAACLRKLVDRLELNAAVHFAGLVDDRKLAAYYLTAHLFWSMSEHEGFCVPLIEAMWFGVPVFAYAAGAVSETMGNAGRLFFSKDDPAGLARQAYALVHDPSLRQEVIERQRERQQAFLPAQVEQQLRGLVERLLGRRSGQVPAIVTAEPIENIREIAVVKLDHVGDLLLASPAFFSLRNRFPRARITAVTTPRSAPVLHHNPHVDCVVPYDPPWLWPETTSTPDGARMAANAQHLNQLLSVPFDLVVNLPSLAHRPSRLLASLLPHRYLLSQFHSDEAGGRSLITHGTEWRPNRHVSRHHLELLRAIGADAWCEPTVYFSDAERARATELGRPTRNTVALALGADTALQRWAQVKFRELARRLRARGYPVTIVGPESDRRLSDDWSAGLGCLDLCGRFELNELAAYLAGIGCLVANNSAPMHLGAAVGIPVVYITNPPAQQEFAPVGRHCVACTQAVCPEPCKGFDPDQPGSTPAFCRCVQSVSVDQVEQNVVQLLTAYEADRPGTPSESLSLGGAPASSS